MSLPYLETIGLPAKEAELYELLLQLGEVPAQTIISKTGHKRASAYKLLYSLETKGLITQRKLNKKIHFRPVPPEKLLDIAHQQQENLKKAESALTALLPELNNLYLMNTERPIVTQFEGVEGLKRIYEDTLREGQPIFAILQTGELIPELFNWLTTHYVKQRNKNKLHAYVLVASGDWSNKYRQLDQQENRTTMLVPSHKFPFQHEINIYGDKIAIINGKKGEKPIGIIIKHPLISQTMKAWFDLAWEAGEKIYNPSSNDPGGK